MIDQEGADVLDEMERGYGNAGTGPTALPPQQVPVDDERMPDEWNRARNQQGELVGFFGQRPIIRPSTEKEEADMLGDEKAGSEMDQASAGVMAALAQLRRQEKD